MESRKRDKSKGLLTREESKELTKKGNPYLKAPKKEILKGEDSKGNEIQAELNIYEKRAFNSKQQRKTDTLHGINQLKDEIKQIHSSLKVTKNAHKF